MRLNRFLSAAGVSSRRKGEEIIKAGRVRVNGVVVDDPARNIDETADKVTVDGKTIAVGTNKRWYVLNKPSGVIVSRGDTHGRATVYDLLGPETEGVFSVGRLDFDTSGVLLFTDDGDGAFRLTHPSFEVEKIYRAEVSGRVTAAEAEKIRQGVDLDDGPTAPAGMTVLADGFDGSIVELSIHEGRKRQVRRMLEAIGHRVRSLERLSFGGVTAQGLPSGHYRLLVDSEVRKMLDNVRPRSTENGQ